MSRLGLDRTLLSAFLRNGHGVMLATRKKIIAMTNSCALVLSCNYNQPGSTAINTAIVNNHTRCQHNKLKQTTIIKLNHATVPNRHSVTSSKLMEAKIRLVRVVTMRPSPFLCLLSDWRLSWSGRGQFMLKVTMGMN